ncbi:TetR/AcrR family transcriptional regulator [Actinomadura sp. WMMB 499]|uniref:TetR/AcrR family transcriptional regulator n=1 Tax=Actinomadura sp. WMMB 499 TaxID=1219491 RepID=UPI001247A269|nr:TetR/AcrR family transcriptional regulator [Actinomadura sp. WMMB 499]QFG24764.1 TetR/AcrR family transcriptional regulator [Actinomadura sp. WMMB 499]
MAEQTGRRRGRLPAAERERRRAEVLDAALSVVTEQGYDRATMSDVAARAGASKETLYAWFGDREGLIAALIEANADASAARLVALVGDRDVTPGTARRALVAYATGLLTLLTGPSSVTLNRAAMASPSLARTLLSSGRHRIGPLVEDYLERLHAAGIVHAPDPGEAYRTLYGLVVRDTQIRVLLGEEAPTAAEIAEHAETAVTGFLALHAPGRPPSA